MDAPEKKLNLDGFNQAIKKHTELHYEVTAAGYVCKTCGGEIQQTTGYASIHSTEFGDECAGPGEVIKFPLPYCPKCEGEPKSISTCIHVSIFAKDPVLATA